MSPQKCWAALSINGATIRNLPVAPVANPDRGWRASVRWHEEKAPPDYPVDASLASHPVDALIDREFDLPAPALSRMSPRAVHGPRGNRRALSDDIP